MSILAPGIHGGSSVVTGSFTTSTPTGIVGLASSTSVLIKHNYALGGAPGVNTDTTAGYTVGSIVTNGASVYLCTDASAGAAAWSNLTATSPPAGTGTELQYRNGSAFGAVAGSSWASPVLFLPGQLS